MLADFCKYFGSEVQTGSRCGDRAAMFRVDRLISFAISVKMRRKDV